MTEIYMLAEEDAEAFSDALAENKQTLADSMDDLAEKVIANGGACDEDTLIAAFFGMTQEHGSYSERWLGLEGMPEIVARHLRRIRLLEYSLGEPYLLRDDAGIYPKEVGIIDHSADEDVYSRVLEYRIGDTRDGYLGHVVLPVLGVYGDSLGMNDEEPMKGSIEVLKIARASGTVEVDRNSTILSRLIVGMPRIRKAVYDSPGADGYIPDNMIHNIERTIGAIRAYAGEAILTRAIDVAGYSDVEALNSR